jgi:predicted dehydrogenase
MRHIAAVLLLALAGTLSAQTEVRIGIIGLDTSHVREFTRMLNDASAPDHVAGGRVVAAYKGGSPDVESSATRIEGFTAELRDKWKIEIVPDIPRLCSKVDAILLESVDGRVHLEQVRPVIQAKKRVFIDKPLAASFEDARTIARLAAEAGVPWFSSSSLRFHPAIQGLKQDVGDIMGCDVYGPSPTEPHHPDLFWYGIHGVEMLFTVMGQGCESVTRVHTDGTDVVVGRWKDGRLGTFRGIRAGKSGYGGTVYGSKVIRSADAAGAPYQGLVKEIVKFFQTGVSPVPAAETLEIMAFMQAAETSKTGDGREVKLPR